VNLRHPGSLRHIIEELKKDSFIETIFDDPFYNDAQDHLRKLCAGHWYLELSRRFFLSDETKLAKKYYLKAVSMSPKAVITLRYLATFIKAYLK
jgi:hypothetical protein